MTQPPKKAKPLGDPVEWTDDDLDNLAEISPTDLKAADVLWQNEAPKKLKKLLQAAVQEGEQPNE